MTKEHRATLESWIVRAQISLAEGQPKVARIQLEAALQALYADAGAAPANIAIPAWMHELKTDPEVFAAVLNGSKTHEIRSNDRDFKIGDTLRLRETRYTGQEMRGPEPRPLEYTGREVTRVVSHVLEGYGLMPGWVILSFASQPSQAQRIADLEAVEKMRDEEIASLREKHGDALTRIADLEAVDFQPSQAQAADAEWVTERRREVMLSAFSRDEAMQLLGVPPIEREVRAAASTQPHLTEDLIKQAAGRFGAIYEDRIVFHDDKFTDFAEALLALLSASPVASNERAGLTDERILDEFERRAMSLRDSAGTPNTDGVRVIEGVRALLAARTGEDHD